MGLEPHEGPCWWAKDASELHSRALRQEQALHHPERQIHLLGGIDFVLRLSCFRRWRGDAYSVGCAWSSGALNSDAGKAYSDASKQTYI